MWLSSLRWSPLPAWETRTTFHFNHSIISPETSMYHNENDYHFFTYVSSSWLASRITSVVGCSCGICGSVSSTNPIKHVHDFFYSRWAHILLLTAENPLLTVPLFSACSLSKRVNSSVIANTTGNMMDVAAELLIHIERNAVTPMIPAIHLEKFQKLNKYLMSRDC